MPNILNAFISAYTGDIMEPNFWFAFSSCSISELSGIL